MATQTVVRPGFLGIYRIPEAALYSAASPPLADGFAVPAPRMRYWMRTSVPYVADSPYPTRQRLITFLDLVSLRMVAMLKSRGVRLNEIRITEAYLRKEWGLEHPFATQSLWTYGNHIFVDFEERLLAASKCGQQAMDFIKTWLREVKLDMTFDHRELASSWSPFRGVCLTPKIQFGEPCIDGTRIPTRAIWSNVRAGDSQEIVSALYEVGIDQIKSAVEWEQRLDATRSAILRN